MSSGNASENPEVPDVDVSDEISVQTPDSALRHPVRLTMSIARDLWAGRELAWRMLEEMYRSGVTPDSFTFSTLVKGIKKNCSRDR